MRKNITPKTSNEINKQNYEEVVAPSKKTLDFLRSFARAYHVEQSLRNGLNGLCVN